MSWVRVGVLTVAVFAATALALVASVIATPAGTRWSLEQVESAVPGLELSTSEGSWATGLQLASLRYRAPTLQLELSAVELELQLAALLGGQIKAQKLGIERTSIVLIDDGSPSSAALPEVGTPLPIIVERLWAPDVELQTSGGQKLVASLDAGLRWRGSHLQLHGVSLQKEALQITGDAGLNMDGDYAVQAKLALQGEALPGVLSLQLEGSLADLSAQGALAGDYPLSFVAQAEMLEQDLPLSFSGRSSESWRVEVAEDAIAVSSMQFSAEGVLDNIRGTLNVEMDERRYGDSELALAFNWHDALLQVQAAQWQSDRQGTVEADCDVDTGVSQWHCRGEIQSLALYPWTQSLAGDVSSEFTLEGQWGDDAASLMLAMPAITGHVESEPLTGHLSLHSANMHEWQLREFQLVVADNRLHAQGLFGDALDLRFAIDAAAISQLEPRAAGSIEASIAVQGPVDAPDLSASVRGSSLSWEGFGASSLSLALDAPQLGRKPSTLRLQLSEAASEQQALGTVELNIDGHRKQHVLAATMSGAETAEGNIHCSGQHRGDNWQLQCDPASGWWRLAGEERSWVVTEMLDIDFNTTATELTVQPFCLLMAPARLCLRQALRYADGTASSARAELQQLPMKWWSDLLPAPYALTGDGQLNAVIDVQSLQPLRAVGNAGIDAFGVTWSPQAEGHALQINSMQGRFELEHDIVSIDMQSLSPNLGTVRLAASVRDPGQGNTLDGHVAIAGLQLEAANGLLQQLQFLSGRLDGEIQLGGSLAQPQLGGGLQIRDASAQQVGQPYSVEKLNTAVNFRGQAADIDAGFSVADGSGAFTGTLSWLEQPQWRLQSTLQLDAVSFGFLEDSVANVSTQLRIGVVPGQVDVAGQLQVNRADIQLHALPPESVSPSDDAEIVGVERAESAWQLIADVGVDLGEQMRFRGFGADLELEGKLDIKHSRRQLARVLGEVRVAEGHYRAYGQRLLIRKGSLLFAGPLDNPDLHLEAIRKSRNTDVVGGLRISGTLQHPVGELFSEPAMAETDVAHFVLTGKVRKRSEAFGNVSAQGTLLSLGLAGANEPAAELASKFGIDDFQISAESTEAGTETRVGGYLTPQLYVSYGALLKERSNTVTLQYQLTPRFVIEAVSGFSSALDFIYNFSID